MKFFSGHEAEMNYRDEEDHNPASKERVEKEAQEQKELENQHPKDSLLFEFFEPDAQEEMVRKFEARIGKDIFEMSDEEIGKCLDGMPKSKAQDPENERMSDGEAEHILYKYYRQQREMENKEQ